MGSRREDPPAGWTHPRTLVRAAAARFGLDEMRAWCARLVSGAAALPDDPPLGWLGGSRAYQDTYWTRTWGLRGLMHLDVGAEEEPVVIAALDDPHWRVREMALRVCREAEVGAAADAAAALATGDGTPRVRRAAVMALARIGEAEHAEALVTATHDPGPRVDEAARRALERMERRLDRTFDR